MTGLLGLLMIFDEVSDFLPNMRLGAVVRFEVTQDEEDDAEDGIVGVRGRGDSRCCGLGRCRRVGRGLELMVKFQRRHRWLELQGGDRT